MSDGHEDKTEQPTEKRLKEAQDRGQFARSPELSVAATLLAGAMTIGATVQNQAQQIALIAKGIFGHLGQYELRAEAAPDWSKLAASTMLGLTLPVMAVCTLTGVVVSGLQSGFRFTPDLLGVKADKLNPMSGFQRIFSKQGLTKLGIDAAKLALVGFVLQGSVRDILSDPIFYTPVEISHLGGFVSEAAFNLLKRSAMVIGIVAAANFIFQKRKLTKDLMMSRQEVKEEHKGAEGDPHVKAQRRAMGRRLMQKQMLAAVATADVIVTNPTHFAVALKYERGRDGAPMVLAKGKNLLAERIKALGAEHDVPRVENVPVARMLYKYGQVGKPIPSQMFQAVAEILAFVYRTHRYYFYQLKARRAAAEQAAKQQKPSGGR